MSSISAASAQSYQSPLQKLQNELLSEVSSGVINSSDKDALSSALTDIDSAMQSSRASDQANGTRPSPDEMKSKIADLIESQVSSGKLTTDQATELQGIFKAAFANGPGGAGGGPGGPGGPGGAGGPPPRSAARGRCVLERREFFEHHFDRRHSQAVFADAAGITVGLVLHELQRDW